MSWHGIVGHDEIIGRFRRSIEQQRLATTFLFVGPEGIGKRSVALKLAQSMLCGRSSEVELAPCGECAECQQVLSDSHPDLQIVQKPEDKAYIPVDTFIGDRDHRMRSGLCHFISLTPAGGSRRIAIIDDADWLNQEGANSLLKTLEEPSPGAIIILISTSLQRQLPTIRSRCQIIHFQPLSDADTAVCLLEQGLAETEEQATTMASRACGSISQAVALANESITEFRRDLWIELAKASFDRGGLTKTINAFVDSAGKDTAGKRNQLRLVFNAAIEFYRSLARRVNDVEITVDEDLQSCVDVVLQRNETSCDVVAAQIERCIDALNQVRMNANLGILVDAWVCDLAVMTRTQRPILSSVS